MGGGKTKTGIIVLATNKRTFDTELTNSDMNQKNLDCLEESKTSRCGYIYLYERQIINAKLPQAVNNSGFVYRPFLPGNIYF
jgi:hypothetical protein